VCEAHSQFALKPTQHFAESRSAPLRIFKCAEF
jgi:hypothetical protein